LKNAVIDVRIDDVREYLIDDTVDVKGMDAVIGWTALHDAYFMAIMTLQSLFYHFVMMKYI
jgi:hypothetical protein